MIVLKDNITKDMIRFLEHCESKLFCCGVLIKFFIRDLCFVSDYGRNIPTMVDQPLQQDSMHSGRNTITYEARLLKALFLRLT